MSSGGMKLSCRCSKVQGILQGASARNGSHVLCHCSDCQAFAKFLAVPEILDRNGGTSVYQTLPGRVTFERGGALLRVLQLSDNGLLRWYAGCCGTPLGNTLGTPKFRFVGVPLAALPGVQDEVGSLIGSFAGKEAPEGAHPPKDFGHSRAMRRAAFRHLASLIGLAPRGSPYFVDGKPIVAPYVLTEDERRKAYSA